MGDTGGHFGEKGVSFGSPTPLFRATVSFRQADRERCHSSGVFSGAVTPPHAAGLLPRPRPRQGLCPSQWALSLVPYSISFRYTIKSCQERILT